MEKFKLKVKNSFNSASKTYDQVAYIQKASAKQLVEALIKIAPEFYPKRILDIGTGTGNIITYLSEYYPNSNYTLNDISDNMIQMAVQKFNNILKINPVVGDLEDILLGYHDLCVSNFTLQWTKNLFYTIKKFYNTSKVFAFTCLLYSTFIELQELLKQNNLSVLGMPIYPKEEYLHDFIISLKPLKYVFYSKLYNIQFVNIKEFFKYLKALGARVSVSTLDINVLKKIVSEKANFSTNYNVLFVVLMKD